MEQGYAREEYPCHNDICVAMPTMLFSDHTILNSSRMAFLTNRRP